MSGEYAKAKDDSSSPAQSHYGRCRSAVRPKMMTVAAIIGGLRPIMRTTGTGADVMKRIAAPMIGGMVSSTILTLH